MTSTRTQLKLSYELTRVVGAIIVQALTLLIKSQLNAT